jgi:uroporphyrinogen decarboxylase
MDGMTHKERLHAVIAGEKPDRNPVALWRHFPVDDQEPETLAASIVGFQTEWNFDFVKVTPASSFCLLDWGAQDVWEGNPEGTRKYVRRVISQPQDWEKLARLDPGASGLAAQIRCLKEVRRRLPTNTPIVQTIFNPLAQAKNLAGKELLMEHLRRFPDALQAGLQTIQQTTRAFTQACMETGIDGIFLAVQHASYRIMDRAEYDRWGKPADLEILQAAQSGWLNILHLHGDAVMMDLAKEYPVTVVNWHDREAGPPLPEGFRQSGKVVCGGWRQWQTIAHGDPGKVREEARDAVAQMDGRHLILGTGCVTPIITPRSCLAAASQVSGA